MSLHEKIITARKRSLGLGNIFSSLCQEFCTWGVCLRVCWDTPIPGSTHPPGADIPTWADTPSGSRHPPGADPPGADHPYAVHAGRYGQQAGGKHPTGMQSCFWNMNRRIGIFWYTAHCQKTLKIIIDWAKPCYLLVEDPFGNIFALWMHWICPNNSLQSERDIFERLATQGKFINTWLVLIQWNKVLNSTMWQPVRCFRNDQFRCEVGRLRQR